MAAENSASSNSGYGGWAWRNESVNGEKHLAAISKSIVWLRKPWRHRKQSSVSMSA
jgi:hypothetical protein